MTKEEIISMLSKELNSEWTNGVTCLMEEKVIVTILWVITIFFLLLVSGIFEGGHEPIKPPDIPHI